jgi:hypothetical protein
MRLTIPHYFDFKQKASLIGDSLDTAAGWDRLRSSAEDRMNFAIPGTPERWRQNSIRDKDILRQAKDIVNLTKISGFDRINSYGVGTAFLEYHVKQQRKDVYLQCSDYTPDAIERLKHVFKEADEIIQFDMLHDQWVDNGHMCLYLFYRVDTAFTDEEWRRIFQKLSAAGIEQVLFIPCEFLCLKRFVTQKIKWVMRTFQKRPLTMAGYLRTKDAFRSMFGFYYVVKEIVRIGSLTGLLLKLRAGAK